MLTDLRSRRPELHALLQTVLVGAVFGISGLLQGGAQMGALALAAGLWMGEALRRIETTQVYPATLPRTKTILRAVGFGLYFATLMLLLTAGPVTDRIELAAPLLGGLVFAVGMALLVRSRADRLNPYYDPAPLRARPRLLMGQWALIAAPLMVFAGPTAVLGTPVRTAFVVFGICLAATGILPLHRRRHRPRKGAEWQAWALRTLLAVAAMVWIVLSFAVSDAGSA